MARGAKERGKRVAFGDGEKIRWDHNSPVIFRGNPNIAPPGSEGAEDLEWVPFYKGSRIYNSHDPENRRWVWNMEFKAHPGEVFFEPCELAWAESLGKGFVVIEPNVPPQKSVAANKQWPVDRFDEVAAELIREGHEVLQFVYGAGHTVPGARSIFSPSFRHALAAIARARLYVGPEGGLHHGAAAVGTPAVVLFGGFIPPQVTGYEMHKNLTGGAEACGSLKLCRHCREAMDRITVDEVAACAMELAA